MGLGSFIACLCSVDSTVLLVCSGLFFAYLFPCLHELGHLLGCVCSKTKIHSIYLLFWKIEQGKASISTTLLPFKVRFYSGKEDAIVYLCGVAVSLLLALLFVCLYAWLQRAWLLPPLVIAFVVLFCNIFGKHSDVRKTFQSFKRGEK